MTDNNKETDEHVAEPTAQKWSSKSLGSRWQHTFFYALIKFGGRWPAYIFSCIVVLCYVLFVPTVHTRSAFYITKRFPEASRLKRWYHTWRLTQSFAFSLIDKAAVGIRGTNEFTYTLNGIEQLQELQKKGKGVILLTAHVGRWQSSIGGLKTLQTAVHLMMLRHQGDVDSQYFDFNTQNNIHIIPVEDTIGSVIMVANALRKNEIVSIMGDRIFPPTQYTASVDFLGDKALFPTAAYRIAQSTGAPVALLLTNKKGHSHIDLTVDKIFTIPKIHGKDYTLYAQIVAQAIEEYTQSSPYQYYNFLNIWSPEHE